MKVVPTTLETFKSPIRREYRNEFGLPSCKPGMFRTGKEFARFALFTLAMGVVLGAIFVMVVRSL